MLNRLLLLTCLLLAFTLATAENLPISVSEALAQAGVADSDISIFAQDVATTEPLLAVRAEEARNPASTMKLVTTLAGLEILGPDHRWKTLVYTNGEQHGDVLEGDVYLQGQGDPSLTLERFSELIAKVRQAGIREIKGDIVLDRSYFDIPDSMPESFDNHPNEVYNCLPDALLVNFNTVELKITPGNSQSKHRLTVTATPNLPQLDLINQLKPAPVACRGGRVSLMSGSKTRERALRDRSGQTYHGKTVPKNRGGPMTGSHAKNKAHGPSPGKHVARQDRRRGKNRTVFVRVRPRVRVTGTRDHAIATFTGNYSAACGERTYVARVLSPMQYAYGTFVDTWRKLGGTIHGGMRLSSVPQHARFLAGTESASLAEIVVAINKNSNNPMARQLFLTLGNHLVPPPATSAKADSAIRGWLQKLGLTFNSLVMENGSGLSHQERISAADLGRLLLHGHQSQAAQHFLTSLPIVSIDGTMKKRLRDHPIAGHAFIKTGSLRDVKAIAGYVHDRQGRTIAVVFFANRPGAGAVTRAQDALLDWLYERA